MDINSTYWFFEKFRNDNLSLLYNGSFIDEITDRFVHISEFNISNLDEFRKLKKRISFLLIECFQNIVSHGEKRNKKELTKDDQGFFATRNHKGSYQIASGNLVEHKKVFDLRNQLNKVNSLTPEELKGLYRKVMENKMLSEKGGAGLGLIDIARKSGQKLEYVFEKFNQDFSMYYSQVTLWAATDENTGEKPGAFPLDDAIEHHKKMLEENIMVIKKGDFSHKAILPILTIIETNLRSEFKESYIKKQIYHILVELLQNINKHCWSENGVKEGILIIGKTKDNFVINTANYIHEEEIEFLDNHIKMLNSMDDDSLKKLYMKKLIEGTEYSENAGIGLIDIARYSPFPLSYKFSKSSDNKSCFTISVII